MRNVKFSPKKRNPIIGTEMNLRRYELRTITLGYEVTTFKNSAKNTYFKRYNGTATGSILKSNDHRSRNIIIGE